jgi:hypothetical protein
MDFHPIAEIHEQEQFGVCHRQWERWVGPKSTLAGHRQIFVGDGQGGQAFCPSGF